MSIPAEFKSTGVDLNIALQLLALPREVGMHPETGKKIVANIGRFGPYLNHDGTFKSIPKTDSVFSIDLPRAVEVLAMAKGKNALRVLGNHPADEGEIAIYDGRFGPYVQHGKLRATLSKSENVDDITLEHALELLAAKAEKEKSGTTKKPAARKTAAKKKAS